MIRLKNSQYSRSVFRDPRAFLTEKITAGGTRFSLLSPQIPVNNSMYMYRIIIRLKYTKKKNEMYYLLVNMRLSSIDVERDMSQSR